MAEVKPLYSTCVAILGFICFVVGATAVGIPMWGYFFERNGGYEPEKGYFGPWKTCKQLHYNRERCGTEDNISFKPTVAVWMAGLVASIGVAILGVFCFLSVIQLAMLNSKEKVVVKYSIVVISKMALSLLVALLEIAAGGLFAMEADNENRKFQIKWGPAFYIQVMQIILSSGLFVMALYDMLFARREGGDPTTVSVPVEATTYGNMGYRDRRTNGGGVSMTDASAKPYVSNGSMASMNTTSTTIGCSVGSTNGSTVGSSVTRSPLRSSLKKPKPKDGLGIQNPGFSRTSPTLSRNGSTKKVRIQTHSTEV